MKFHAESSHIMKVCAFLCDDFCSKLTRFLSWAVELGLVIGKPGRDISQANAESHIAGYSMSFGHRYHLRSLLISFVVFAKHWR